MKPSTALLINRRPFISVQNIHHELELVSGSIKQQSHTACLRINITIP
jgi:hypothetical protein